MSIRPSETTSTRLGDGRAAAAHAAAGALKAVQQLAGGFGTALLAAVVLVAVVACAALSLIGVGLLLAPVALAATRAVADRERARLSHWGPDVVGPGPRPVGLLAAVSDRGVQREVGWVATHATVGLVLGLVGVLLPLFALRDTTVALWWWLLPPDAAGTSWGGGGAASWAGTIPVTLLGVGWLAIILGLAPGMARLQARPGRRLLAAGPEADLSLRVAQLTATRAAALDAHTAELRRIERSLHDGSQNRLVAVTVLVGAARRALARDPDAAPELLERAQSAAEQALAELRTVARGILPPVLVDRGLDGALAGLATTSAVPCDVEVDIPDRCAASVEATAYFVVAEALTNAARHSSARHVQVTARRRGQRLVVSITDDGVGGASEQRGSGLLGIRRRVEAHDGGLTVTSPAGGPTVVRVELPCGS